MSFMGDRIGLSDYRGIATIFYEQEDFESVSTEESIAISRAPRTNSSSGAEFWLAALLQKIFIEEEESDEDSKEILEEYVANAKYSEISEPDALSIIREYCAGLITKPKFPLNGGDFVCALIMYDQSADQMIDLYMEYENEYIRFYWESSA